MSPIRLRQYIVASAHRKILQQLKLLREKKGVVSYEDLLTFNGTKCSPGSCSDEAHFWLNGYVNKQNCRIWSEANPQVYVKTPLHPEKLTVWSALWAGGILLQKR
ncbi:hypothetical protein TNCV_1678391 [Trichonephila clavipes]|nr:hypothetical protein TNCV_1678391 [Trichonephila clavipes]